MKLHAMRRNSSGGYVTFGSMWRRGECTDEAANRNQFALVDAQGRHVDVQSRITAYWPDGSVKWAAHTADAAKLGDRAEITLADHPSPIDAERSQHVTDDGTTITIASGRSTVTIDRSTHRIFESFVVDGRTVAANGTEVLELEDPNAGEHEGDLVRRTAFTGRVDEIELESEGPLVTVIKYTGIHVADDGTERLPFIIRMTVGFDADRLDFQHTFIYDGDENHDFLKGLGVRFESPMAGKPYNRHVRFEGDHGTIHECLAQLLTWKPVIPSHLYEDQQAGRLIHPSDEAGETIDASGVLNQTANSDSDNEKVETVLKDMPWWDEYHMVQDAPSHFAITKKTADEQVCRITTLHGNRTRGGASFGSEAGSVMVAVKDFWQKYPTGYTFTGLTTDVATATVWLWSPDAQAMDFRHYAQDGYQWAYYEGYDYKGADPVGIACTNEFSIAAGPVPIPDDETLLAFSKAIDKPEQYLADPEYYHELGAFGRWSLPERGTEMENWIEDQLDRAIAFYEKEIDLRNWYGMFDYGDIMHSYDSARHQWRYDMGGFAWDNAELVPTYWMWYAFLRTGREDIFDMASKLCRHVSEVDVYHLGRYKGLGSRHNVRHWGCPCKEARISMAGHHRVYYFLTGDRRFEDLFDELGDVEQTFFEKDPLGDWYDKDSMVYPAHARSGPDWSSLCSDWMTQLERTNSPKFLNKIQTGIDDIKAMDLQLNSGVDMEFDPATCHLHFINNESTGGVHLAICQGAPEVWIEMKDLVDDPDWPKMVADFGRFYFLPHEQVVEESHGALKDRAYPFPFFASAIGAYAAEYYGDKTIARKVWKYLIHALMDSADHTGFDTVTLHNVGNQAELEEVPWENPWFKTNFVAQWCLNAIVALDFIRDDAPKTLAEADELTAGLGADTQRKS
ncbi:hypothetical protein [Bifidobacterium simiarum]|uniref:exo-rhamnogalacturonan lyase family protein n=1 Tax=Bifidobacterium simiarum TaxID=2045441 RepID=UPI001BDD5FE3|nr:hypothetical protein [Bifidobacterium simiarum]MBT1167151.1 hypothetical protein [Bifidobacterium simiarum]